MRTVFMGTPDFAVPTLDALVAAGHDIVCVYTQPPRPAGRGKALSPSPVQRRAEALGIAVRHPARLRDPADQVAFAALDADVAVVAAYGLILPQAVLDAPKHGCINVHASLLPRWRGAAPVQRAILAGDSVTGVTIMQMEAGLDTGPMRAKVEVAMDGKDAGTLTAELAQAGATLLVDVLGNLSGHAPFAQPDEGVTHAAKIDKSEARLDFLVSAPQVVRQIRAFAPAPGAFFELNGERFRILEAIPVAPAEAAAAGHMGTQLSSGPGLRRGDARPATVIDDALSIACNPGAIRPTRVQRAGKSAMAVAELLRGYPIPRGTVLS